MQTYDLDVNGTIESMLEELGGLDPNYTMNVNKKITIDARAKIVFDFENEVVHHYLTP